MKLLYCSVIFCGIVSVCNGYFQRMEVNERPEVSLNGYWEVYTVDWGQSSQFNPSETRYGITLPQDGMRLDNGTDLVAQNNYCYWLVKQVNVPANWAGKQVFLTFRYVIFSTEVYVNDQLVGQSAGQFYPIQFDITDMLVPGAPNTIRVKLRDWRAGASDGGAMFQDTPYYTYSSKPLGSIVYPMSMQFSASVGFHDDIYLTVVGDVYVDDIFAKPSYQNNTLDANITICNASEFSKQIVLKTSVFGGAQTVLSDDFESGTLSSNGWSIVNAGTYPPYYGVNLDSSTFVNGTKSMRMAVGQNYSWRNMSAARSFTPQSNGKLSVWVKSSHNDNGITPARFYLQSPSGDLAYLLFNAQYGIYFNGQPVFLYNANQWYYVEITWNGSSKLVDLWIDHKFVMSCGYQNVSAASADTIKFLHHSTASVTLPAIAWYDDLEIIGQTSPQVLDFDDVIVNLNAGESKTLSMGKSWNSARKWSPVDPYLYKMRCSIVENDIEIDTRQQSFGFREVWTDNKKLLINGIPVKLFQAGFFNAVGWNSTSFLRTFYQNDIKGYNLNSVRWTGGMLPDRYMDIADEMGIMITVEPDTTHCFGGDFLSETYWQRIYNDVAGFTKLYRNNPSVVTYSGGNEILIYGLVSDYNDVQWALDKYAAIRDVIRAHDATRPVMFEGNGALEGRDIDIYNNHAYEPEDCKEWPLYSFTTDQLNTYQHSDPNTNIWDDANDHNAVVPWSGDMPMMLGEMFSMYKLPLECLTYIAGEEIYRGMLTDLVGYYTAGSDLLTNIVSGYRYRDVAGQDPWGLTFIHNIDSSGPHLMGESEKNTYKSSRFYVYDQFFRYFASRNDESKVLIVFNDNYDANAADISIVWQLMKDGDFVQEGVESLSVASGDSQEIAVNFNVPAILGDYQMHVTMSRNGIVVDSQDFPIRVLGDLSQTIINTSTTPVSIYDPNGQTNSILSNILPSLQELSTLDMDGHGLLIIGEQSYDSQCDENAKSIREWVQNGGNLLILGQEYISSPLEMDFTVDKSTIYTGFVRAKGHPVFAGLENDDFITWRDSFKVGFNSFRKFSQGSVRSLIDSGYGHEGMIYSLLSEQTYGGGRILYCQLRIIENYAHEPAAQMLLKNMIEYLCTSSQPVFNKIAVVTQKVELISQFENLGITVDNTSNTVPPATPELHPVIWVDASAESGIWLEENAALVNTYLQTGGNVFVDAIDPNSITSINNAFGTNLSVSPSILNIQHLEYGSGERDPILWGISLADVTWDMYSPPFYTEKIVSYTVDKNSLSAGMIPLFTEPDRIGYRASSWYAFWVNPVWDTANTPNYNSGHSFIRYPVGAGNLYFSMLQLQNGYNGLERTKSERITCALLNNMDVSMDLSKARVFLTYPVEAENFIDNGKVIEAKGFASAGWIKLADGDRVKFQIEGLRRRRYRVSFKIAGTTNPMWSPVDIYINGQPVPSEFPIQNFRSILKGEGWEYFGGDLFAQGVYTLDENSIMEVEAKGDYPLVFNLTLIPIKCGDITDPFLADLNDDCYVDFKDFAIFSNPEASSPFIWSDNFDYAAGQTLQDNGWQLSVGGTYGQQGLDSTVSVSPTNSLTQWSIPWAPYQMISAKHSFASTAKGSIGIDMRSSHAGLPSDILSARYYLTSATGTVASVVFSAQWGIYINGAGYSSFNANQWYHIDLSWDDSTGQISAIVDDDPYVLVANYYDASASGANGIEILHHGNHDPDANVQTWYDNVVVSGLSVGNSDLNQDGVVDFSDLAILALEWLQCNDPENSDCI